MVDICCDELEKIDISLNVSKSQVVRIGKLLDKKVNSVVINGSPVEFVAEKKYLGWYILSANVFRISLHYMRVLFINVLTLCMQEAVISVNLFFSIL